jgi:hypothetical protein
MTPGQADAVLELLRERPGTMTWDQAVAAVLSQGQDDEGIDFADFDPTAYQPAPPATDGWADHKYPLPDLPPDVAQVVEFARQHPGLDYSRCEQLVNDQQRRQSR